VLHGATLGGAAGATARPRRGSPDRHYACHSVGMPPRRAHPPATEAPPRWRGSRAGWGSHDRHAILPFSKEDLLPPGRRRRTAGHVEGSHHAVVNTPTWPNCSPGASCSDPQILNQCRCQATMPGAPQLLTNIRCERQGQSMPRSPEEGPCLGRRRTSVVTFWRLPWRPPSCSGASWSPPARDPDDVVPGDRSLQPVGRMQGVKMCLMKRRTLRQRVDRCSGPFRFRSVATVGPSRRPKPSHRDLVSPAPSAAIPTWRLGAGSIPMQFHLSALDQRVGPQPPQPPGRRPCGIVGGRILGNVNGIPTCRGSHPG